MKHLSGLAALLAVLSGGMGIGVPAVRAQDLPEINFILSVRFADTDTVHDVKCDEKVDIAAVAFAEIRFRGVVISEFVPGLSVIGSAGSRGTLAPSRAPVRQLPVIGKGRYASAAGFTYTAKENGKESLTFQFQGRNGQPLATQTIKFEVQDCEVNVSMIYDGTFDVGGGITVRYAGIMDKVRVEADEDSNLHGEGVLDYKQFTTGLPGGCSASWTGWNSNVTITGQSEEDQIGLNFDFAPVTMTGTVGCDGFFGSGSSGGNPSVMFATSLIFPSGGGVMVYPSPGQLPATVTVIVTREEEEEAVSSRGPDGVLAVLGNP